MSSRELKNLQILSSSSGQKQIAQFASQQVYLEGVQDASSTVEIAAHILVEIKQLDEKKPCRYWDQCYRKNPVHLEKYIHPEKEEDTDTDEDLPIFEWDMDQ
jgi:predicted GTPase